MVLGLNREPSTITVYKSMRLHIKYKRIIDELWYEITLDCKTDGARLERLHYIIIYLVAIYCFVGRLKGKTIHYKLTEDDKQELDKIYTMER